MPTSAQSIIIPSKEQNKTRNRTFWRRRGTLGPIPGSRGPMSGPGKGGRKTTSFHFLGGGPFDQGTIPWPISPRRPSSGCTATRMASMHFCACHSRYACIIKKHIISLFVLTQSTKLGACEWMSQIKQIKQSKVTNRKNEHVRQLSFKFRFIFQFHIRWKKTTKTFL